MKERLLDIEQSAVDLINKAETREGLEKIRVRYLGKKGEITSVLRGMGKLPPEERPVVGKLANELRKKIEELLAGAMEVIEEKEKLKRLEEEVIDVTIPGRRRPIGNKHPMTKVLDEIKNIFIGLGYGIAEGPEVETDYNNFEALNIPKNHPARDTQDTFYISENVLLRTHTSPVQIRVMKEKKPPIKVICPGRVYRSDEVDATHLPIFHQVEGLVVDKGITLGDLKGTLNVFAKQLFGEKTKVKFRPHHFPFTEPSAEVDVSCFACGGKGCPTCKGEGWIEILGAGMVHPNVLKNCGIDPDVYSGFAFGMGVERIVMKYYGVEDMRLFFENDVRFLKQF